MTKYTEWREKSKRFAYTVSLLPQAEDVLNTLARAAYEAGERAGLKTVDECRRIIVKGEKP